MSHAAIILAAGPSSRMGTAKQMLHIDGQPLLLRSVNAVIQSGIDRVAVVLGANEEEHGSMLEGFAVDTIINADWKKGMGTSIRAGLQALLSKYQDIVTTTILVCDQPLLTPDIILQLIAKHKESGKPIVSSAYNNTCGVPALFALSYFEKLMQLPDQNGAKKLILQNPSDVMMVPFPGGEIDLDTPEDYERFVKSQRR